VLAALGDNQSFALECCDSFQDELSWNSTATLAGYWFLNKREVVHPGRSRLGLLAASAAALRDVTARRRSTRCRLCRVGQDGWDRFFALTGAVFVLTERGL
jgi:hypothetical protein